jgi:hypothetical protein
MCACKCIRVFARILLRVLYACACARSCACACVRVSGTYMSVCKCVCVCVCVCVCMLDVRVCHTLGVEFHGLVDIEVLEHLAYE